MTLDFEDDRQLASLALDGKTAAEAPSQVDQVRVEAAVREFLIAIGEDPQREGLLDTPGRVARAAVELFSGVGQEPDALFERTFDAAHDEMVLVKQIELHSVCEHHLLPFHGVAHVAYIPPETGRVAGLSKLARLVELYARRPQVQERLTSEIADAIMRLLDARGALVVVECEHMCMTMRGVKQPTSRTVTSAVRGQFTNGATRAEALSLIMARD